MNNILRKTQNFFKEIFFFLSSKVFFKNIFLMLVTVIAFFTFAYLSLNWITHHNKFTETPNVVGLTLEEVQRKYPNFNFHIDSTNYNKDIPPLTIITQDPYPKEKIKHRRTIYLTVTPFMPSLKTVPLIYGKQLNRALVALNNSGFEGKILRFENDKADSTILKVLYFNPKTGDSTVLGTQVGDVSKVPEGSILHLVVARIGEEVPVPDLACNTYDAARFLLEGSELNVGNVGVYEPPYVARGVTK